MSESQQGKTWVEITCTGTFLTKKENVTGNLIEAFKILKVSTGVRVEDFFEQWPDQKTKENSLKL